VLPQVRHDHLVTGIDHEADVPVYLQLAAILRGQIERGELVPRQPLPSETYLVQHYGVSRGTARRSVAVLRDEGLVRTIPQRGSYVVQRP
jgi:GntR family transcriptional regulator